MMMSEKKMPLERTCAELMNVVLMPEPTPRCSAGRLFITPARFGEPNDAMANPMRKRRRGEGPVGEVHRQELHEHEQNGRGGHPPGREDAGTVAIRQDPR